MAKTCCSCIDDKEGHPVSDDTCMCGCGYLNGWMGVIGVQLLSVIGLLFSIAALGDCSFMELDERLFFGSDLDEDFDDFPLKVTQTQYVGFLTWKMLDGNCYFYVNGSDPEGQINFFMDILGRDWELARLLAMLTSCLSCVYCCYLLSFTCSSQTRGVRKINAIFSSVILTTLQGLSFLTFDSSFCDDYGCSFSRSAGFCVAAMGCFFLSGICVFCMTDYPGPRASSKKPKLMTLAQVAPTNTTREMPETTLVEEKNNEEGNYMYSEEYVMEDYEDEEVVEDDGEEEVVEDEGEEEVIEDEEEIEEEIVEDSENQGEFDDSHPGLEAGEDMEVFTEVTEEGEKTIETITHADGSQTVTETMKESV